METEQMAAVSGGYSKAERKQVKADKKRAEHEAAQRRTGEFTPAQRLMRDELYPPRTEMAAGGLSGRVAEPKKLSEVLDAVVGPEFAGAGRQVTEQLALEIIDEHGEGIRTGMREWAIIQRMVQEGVRRGMQLKDGTTFS